MGETAMQATRLQWSGELPSLFLASGQDGVVNLYSHHDTLNPSVMKSKKAGELAAPIWLHRKAGVTVGFGGKVASFTGTTLTVSSLAQDKTFAKAARDFDALASQGDMAGLCATKTQENAGSEADCTEWKFLQALAENKKEGVLRALGFDPQVIINEAELYSGKRITGVPAASGQESTSMGSLSKEEAEGFFTTLVETVPEKKEPRSRGVSSENLGLVEHISRNMNWNEGVEKVIKQSMLIGNLEGAVDCCFKCGRTAEALILASFAGDELFTKTKEKFLQTHKDPFLQTTFSHVISRNLSNLIDSKAFYEWKEVLAYCVTYSTDGGKQLAMNLGNELLQKRNDVDSAIICYIVANAFGSALELWTRKLSHALRQVDRRQRPLLLHRTFEKAFALRMITRSFESSPAFDALVVQYALALSGNGAKDLALKYLELASPNNVDVLRVKDRIIGSNPRLFAGKQRHPLPYPVIEVRVLILAKPAAAATHPKEPREKNRPLYQSPLSPTPQRPAESAPRRPTGPISRGPYVPPPPVAPTPAERPGMFDPSAFSAPIQPPRFHPHENVRPPPPRGAAQTGFVPPVVGSTTFTPQRPDVFPPARTVRPPEFRPPPVRPSMWTPPKRDEEQKEVAPPPAAHHHPGGAAPPSFAPNRELLEQANFGIRSPKPENVLIALANEIGRSRGRSDTGGGRTAGGPEQGAARGLPNRPVLLPRDRCNGSG